MSKKNRLFALWFYWLTGLVMLALLLLDLRSEGEVSLQGPLLFFMGIFVTGPLFLLFFIIPSIKAAADVHRAPRDPMLLAWSWLHLAFWLFLFNNVMFLVDALVVHRDTIHIAWGAYAVIASLLPVIRHVFAGKHTRLLLLAAILLAAGIVNWAWDPRTEEFQPPARPDADSMDLLRSATDGDFDSVSALFGRGASLDARDNIGWDALHNSVFEGHYELARYLLEQGSDPNTRGFNKTSKELGEVGTGSWIISGRQSVLGTALRLGDAPMAELLVRHGAESDSYALAFAAALGDLGGIQRELAENHKQVQIDFAVKAAASRPDRDALEAMLAAGGDRNKALWSAAWFSRAEHVRYLLELGAEANARLNLDGPPLMSGLDRRHDRSRADVMETVSALVNAGADVNYVHEFGCRHGGCDSVLIRAVRRGNVPAVKALLAHGADAAWRDGRGMNALDHATRLGNADLARILENQAD